MNKVHSSKTQLQYAYAELPFVCKPEPGKKRPNSPWTSGTTLSLNLGEVLRGDRLTVSDYLLAFDNDVAGVHLCDVEVDELGLERAREVIRDGYIAEWIVDNLPGATNFENKDKSKKFYAAGFPMGKDELARNGEIHYYLNNHVTLLLLYRSAPGKAGERGEKVIVGFEVYPKSIEAGDRDKEGVPKHLEKPKHPFELPPPRPIIAGQVRETVKIPYTYSVLWKEDTTVEWSSRWDYYFVNQTESSGIHWFAIINSLVICGLLTTFVAVILARTVRGDIAATSGKDIETQIKMKRRHSRAASRAGLEGDNGILAQPKAPPTIPEEDEENLEDITGWKLLHGDVFRTPFKGGLLAPLVGSGMQLFFMASGLVTLSCLGVLNPSFRGGFESVGFALFIFAGVFSGYYSGRLFATFGHQRWRRNVLIVRFPITLVLSCSTARHTEY